MMTVNVKVEIINPETAYQAKELEKELQEAITETLLSKVDFIGTILPSDLDKIVLGYFENITAEDLRKKTREEIYVLAKHTCIFLLKRYSLYSIKAIGRIYGGLDHSSVLHALKSIQDRIDTDKRFVLFINSVESKVKIYIHEQGNGYKSMPSCRVSAERYLQEAEGKSQLVNEQI